jgi:deoxyribodipyrimidine photo-lyase
MKSSLVIYWSRRDLRITDNPALAAAVNYSKEISVPLLPLFILEPYMTAGDPRQLFGYSQRWFLARALPHFAHQFPAFAIVEGQAAAYLINLAAQYEVTIFVNDDIYIDFYTQLEKVRAAGIDVRVSEDALTVAKDTRSKEGKLYSVFTPFKKTVWQSFVEQQPIAAPDLKEVTYAAEAAAMLPALVPADTETLESLFSKRHTLFVNGEEIDLSSLVGVPDLTGWYTEEKAARAHFSRYLAEGTLDAYHNNRDSLELDAEGEGKTSKMSLALAWGLVSARMLMAEIRKYFGESFDNPFSIRVSQGAVTYISELIWREFYRYQLFHHPELMQTEFQERFRGTIRWMDGDTAKQRFIAWIKGETGYPIVDAAMRQIAATGWMHNRSRMIVASILTKNLGVDWRWGQEYFRAALIDLDEASNNGGWQWGASVGADPKPIRIFNPELQAKNYDASGAYQEKWLSGGIVQAEPVPVVEHKVAREEALKRYGLTATQPRDY